LKVKKIYKSFLKKAEGISIETLIRSNITNTPFSIGTGTLVSGFSISKKFLYFDIPFWFFASVLAILLIKRKKLTLFRGESAILILVYSLFVFLKIRFFL